MASGVQAATTEVVRQPAFRREVTLWETVGLSIAGASPTLAMAFSGPGIAVLVGRAAALSFVFAAVTVLCIGYAFMLLARKYNNAGNVYGFVGESIGSRSGFFAGWAMGLMYFVFVPGSIAASAFFVLSLVNTFGWMKGDSYLIFAIPITLLVYAGGVAFVRRSTRVLLYIEAASVCLLTVIMIIVLVKVGAGHGLNGGHLTLSIFQLPTGANIHDMVLGAVFGFIAFTGFEAAGALGEEARNPERAVPRAIGISVVTIAIFYVACIAVQSLGFGATKSGAAAFASSSGPLFYLANAYVGPVFRDIILAGAAFSAFGAALSEVIAGARLVFGMTRDAAPTSMFARLTGRTGIPARGVILVIGINLICLVILGGFLGANGFTSWQYLGTLGTLTILVGYLLVALGAARAVINGRLGVARWRGAVPILAAVAILFTFYNELIPAPAFPYNILPYIALVWLLAGLGLIVFAPGLAQRVGTGLLRDIRRAREAAAGDQDAGAAGLSSAGNPSQLGGPGAS